MTTPPSLDVGVVIDATIVAMDEGDLTLSVGEWLGRLPVFELAWRIEDRHPDRLAVGQSITVQVIAVHLANRRFSASVRSLSPEDDPWMKLRLRRVGEAVNGFVTKCFRWGAAVRLEDHTEAAWRYREGEQTSVGAPFVGVVVAVDHHVQYVELRPVETGETVFVTSFVR